MNISHYQAGSIPETCEHAATGTGIPPSATAHMPAPHSPGYTPPHTSNWYASCEAALQDEGLALLQPSVAQSEAAQVIIRMHVHALRHDKPPCALH
jgi:hypothetical protein